MRAAVLLPALLVFSLALPGCFDGVLGGDPPGPRDYVSSKDYDKWVIEVDTVTGMAPPNQAVTLLKQRLESVVSKPAGIDYRISDTLPADGRTWSVRDLQAYSKQHLDAETKGDTVVIHLLFLDGRFEQDDALGVTISQSRGGKVVSTGPIAIFSDAIRDACAGTLLNPSLCTSSDPIFGPVMVHEFGHAMGLVDNGAPMKTPHEASECQGRPDQGHSSNARSVMNCDVETTNVLSLSAVPTDFDANDRADLCGIGGKC